MTGYFFFVTVGGWSRRLQTLLSCPPIRPERAFALQRARCHDAAAAPVNVVDLSSPAGLPQNFVAVLVTLPVFQVTGVIPGADRRQTRGKRNDRPNLIDIVVRDAFVES